MDRNRLLAMLPAFRNDALLIAGDQSVNDIIKEVLKAHQQFASDYDSICESFLMDDIYQTCEKLFKFCKTHIRYQVESDADQTTRSPAGIIAMAEGDCKHYAGFIAGNLDAMNRIGEKINWTYRFASYKDDDPEPQHVFVVVTEDDGNEIWIDPVLESFDQKSPYPLYYVDKKPKMSLHRISGLHRLSGTDDQQIIGATGLPSIPGVKFVASQGDVDANEVAIEQAYSKLLGSPVILKALVVSVDTKTLYVGSYIDYSAMALMASLGINVAYYWKNGAGASTIQSSQTGDGSVYNVWENSVRPWLHINHPDIEQSWVDQYHAFITDQEAKLTSDALNIINTGRKIFTQTVQKIFGLDVSQLFKPVAAPGAAPVPISAPATTTPGATPGNILQWIENNPLYAAGIGVAVYLLFFNKQTRTT